MGLTGLKRCKCYVKTTQITKSWWMNVTNVCPPLLYICSHTGEGGGAKNIPSPFLAPPPPWQLSKNYEIIEVDIYLVLIFLYGHIFGCYQSFIRNFHFRFRRKVTGNWFYPPDKARVQKTHFPHAKHFLTKNFRYCHITCAY